MSIGVQVTDPKFPQRARVTIADGLAKELVDAYNLVGYFFLKIFPNFEYNLLPHSGRTSYCEEV